MKNPFVYYYDSLHIGILSVLVNASGKKLIRIKLIENVIVLTDEF